MSRDARKKQDAKQEEGGAQRHPTNFPLKFANYLAERSLSVAYSFICYTQFPSFEESRNLGAFLRFFSLSLASLSLSRAHPPLRIV